MTQSNLTFFEDQKIPEGYKKTEVGIIPNDWQTPKFGEICTLVNGRGFKPYEWSKKGLPIIRIQNLNGSDDFNYYEGAYDPKIFIENGQLLFAWSGSRGTSFGPHIWKGQNALLNYHTWKLNINHSKVDDKYFYHILKSLTKIIEDSAHGASALVHTQKGEMEKFDIPLPPSRIEQQKIATVLSDTDALISELEKLIEKNQAIKTATMQQLLTGKTRLPEFALREDGKPKGYKDSELGQIPEDWVALSIGSDTSLKARIGWQALTTAEYLKEGNYYLVTGTDFNGGLVNWNSCCYVSEWRYKQDKNIQLQKHDVLVTKDGTIGKVGFIESLPLPATLNSGVFVVRPKLTKCLPRYLFYILTSSYFDDFVKLITAGSTIVHLYQKDFVNFKFYVPRNIEEQSAIANILADLDTELAKLNLKLDKLKYIKQGMMQELLTGKTRLV